MASSRNESRLRRGGIMKRENVWLSYKKKDRKALEKLASSYRDFLSTAKTERLAVRECIRLAREAGYVSIEEMREKGEALTAGSKVYVQRMNKAIALFCIGEEDAEKGLRILGAHIDSPRLDVKQNPLYEDNGLVLMDTHYYGGIKKYQWVAHPLALYGIVVKKDGTKVDIAIGDKEEDPVFCITDLLPHLGRSQMERKAPSIVEGEDLDLLVGSEPLKNEKKDAVKANLLKLLKEQYDIEEEDFLSAELEVVPAGPARELGFDRSMILGYGQDDRVCSFASLAALLDVKNPRKTSCCLLVDKEEIGSVGASGMDSNFLEDAIAEFLDLSGKASSLAVRRTMRNSDMLSSDVSAAFDPLYASVMEKKNAAFLGQGLTINKYTGARGKSGSNDANAEYMAFLRRVFEEAKVAFQTCELGKVDEGGGGTIAYLTARYGMNVIDSGVAVLSMHAPFEVTSKADLYEMKKGFVAFLEAGDASRE